MGATVLALISGGILYHGAAVFFSPIRRDLNLSSANTSLIFTIARAQTSLVAPLYGWLVDRIGPRPLIVAGALVSGIGLIAITLINNYIAFLLAYLLLVSVPSSFGFGQTLLTAVNGWFIRRKAIAMTILLTGFAAGGAIFVYPLGIGVDNIGWRATSVLAGVVVLVIGLMVAMVVTSSPTGEGNVVEDDLTTYIPAMEYLGVDHQVCIAHVKKWVWNRLGEIGGWNWYMRKVWSLMTKLPHGGGRQLLDMEPRLRGQPRLHRLVVELCEKWWSLTCHQRVRGMPQTNNCTERTIGRSKIRCKAVRGYKSEDGMMNGLGLTQWVWSGHEGLEFGRTDHSLDTRVLGRH